MRMFFFLLLSLVPSAAVASDFCAARSTNQLAWNEAFQAEVHRFLGHAHEDFYWPGGDLYEQVSAGLGGPPGAFERLDENFLLAAACRHQSCPEKAAVVIQCPAVVVAVGVLHFNCREEDGRSRCERNPTLTLFTGPEVEGPDPSAALKRWAAIHADDLMVEHRINEGK